MQVTLFTPSPTTATTATSTAPVVAQLQPRAFADLVSNCIAGVEFSTVQCASLDQAIESCTSFFNEEEKESVPSPTAGPFAKCFCQQGVIDNIVGCQNEHRKCINGYLFDHEFSTIQSQWSSFCTGAYMESSWTTAPGLSITGSAGADICASVTQECSSYLGLTSTCDEISVTDRDTQSMLMVSCLCQDEVVMAESICLYDGNRTCAGVEAHRSDLWGYRNCPTWLGATSSSNSIDGWQRGQPTTTPPSLAGGQGQPLAGYSLSFSTLSTRLDDSGDGPSLRAGLLFVGIGVLLALVPNS